MRRQSTSGGEDWHPRQRFYFPQLGAMKAGDVMDVIVSSPPYNLPMSQDHNGSHGGQRGTTPSETGAFVKYGNTEGQLEGLPMGETPVSDATSLDIPTATWTECYNDSWKKIITPESFAHPAKCSRGLLTRILDFMLAEGWLKKGDVCLDPFAGVATTGIECASRGIRFVGVELEPRFHRLAGGYDCPGLDKAEWVRWYGRYNKNLQLCPTCQGLAREAGYVKDSGVIPTVAPHHFVGNFDLHRRKWEQFGDPLPCVIQGDSRRLRQVLAEAGAVVSSPPWQDQVPNHQKEGVDWHQKRANIGKNNSLGKSTEYGTTEGQLGALPPGSIDSVVASPPYSDTPIAAMDKAHASGGQGNAYRRTGQSIRSRDGLVNENYSSTPGQLGTLPPGSVEAVVASPPYAECIDSRSEKDRESDVRQQLKTGHRREHIHGLLMGDYGTTPGQLGALPPGSVEAVVASPPYAQTIEPRRETTREADRAHRARIGRNPNSPGSLPIDGYGTTPGQLGAMPPGQLDAAVRADGLVASPPWERSLQSGSVESKIALQEAMVRDGKGHKGKAGPSVGQDYGNAPGQLGSESGATFWEAAAQIVRECYAVLRPNAIACWIVKDFVRAGKRVEFSRDWLRLLVACGFEPVLWVKASLITTQEEPGLFAGVVKRKKERKSFFRRLHESKLPADDPRRIDHEDVLFVRRSIDG